MAGRSLDELEALAARVPDGASLAIFKEPQPVAAARALARRGARDLHLITVPTGGLAVDLLIAAGCVRTVETSGVTLGEHGPAPAFVRAVKEGRVRPLDATCPAIYAALQAGEKGIPFMPIRGVLGSDVLANRPDWQVIDNPFADGTDPIVLVPALRPDIALIHAVKADQAGNVWVGAEHALQLVAHAAKRTLVTVEEVVDADLMADPLTAAGTIPALYVEAVARAPRGAWPAALGGLYEADAAATLDYVRRATDEPALRAWLEGPVPGRTVAA